MLSSNAQCTGHNPVTEAYPALSPDSAAPEEPAVVPVRHLAYPLPFLLVTTESSLGQVVQGPVVAVPFAHTAQRH